MVFYLYSFVIVLCILPFRFKRIGSLLYHTLLVNTFFKLFYLFSSFFISLSYTLPRVL